jgi:hypothetical protein
MLPPRPHHLDRTDGGHAAAGMREGRPWWRPRRDWPRGLRFENVAAAALTFERLTDGGMPARPLPAGTYGCAADMCATSRFAESEIDSDLNTPISRKSA